MARPSSAAVGDTKRPLYYLTISGVVNIILNVLLVAGLKLSVAGVAIATIVSEFISAALVLASLITSHGDIRFEPKKTRIEHRSLSLILRIGIPAGLQSSMFSISNVLIQSAINSFGAAAIAGNTAAASIEGLRHHRFQLHLAGCPYVFQPEYGRGEISACAARARGLPRRDPCGRPDARPADLCVRHATALPV